MNLTPSQIERLTTEGLVAFLSQAAKFEAHLAPSCSLVLSGEPVADLNYLLAGRKATVEGFVAGAKSCLERKLPFLAMLFPGAAETLAGSASELGLQLAVEFPFMVAVGAPPAVDLGDVVVRRAAGEAGALASGRALQRAFGIPIESVLRAVPADCLDSPSLEVWIAELKGTCVGTVTITHHGDAAGVWAMGVDPETQRKGIGRRLLTTAMREAAKRGTQRFFLGATPAGKPLYDRLGFATQLVTQVWASGESTQT
jgi:GNAT superfamily N-acetyltransferase